MRPLALLLGVLLWAAPYPAVGAQPASYPGFFPAVDARSLAALQAGVDQGQLPWLKDPAQVAQAFALAIHWPQPPTGAKLLQRSKGSALVAIPSTGAPAVNLLVQLRQLGRPGNGIWSVIGCHTADLWITSPTPGQTTGTRIRVQGKARVFEAALSVAVLGPTLKQIALVHTRTAGGYKGASPFATTVSSKPRGVVAVVKAFALSPKDGSLAQVAMVRVTIRH